MKKFLVPIVIVSGLVFGGDALVRACGSKFLVSSRGVRYQRVLANIQPTSILFYWQQDESTPEEDRWNPDASKMLEEVGHSVDVAFDADTFLASAKRGEFDVLVVPIDEARRLEREIAAAAPQSALLPLLLFPTRTEYSRAREEFDLVMKFPTTSPKFLAALEMARSSASN